MASPICRWKNIDSVNSVKEIIELLPKEKMTIEEAKKLFKGIDDGTFFKTASQTARQLGLYYEENKTYIPRFYSTPTDEEINIYLKNWIKMYYAPNPYTRNIENKPLSIHSALCELLITSKRPINFNKALNQIFNQTIKNDDILKNAINAYSDVLYIDSMKMLNIKASSIKYHDLEHFIFKINSENPKDKTFFFKQFNISDNKESVIQDIKTLIETLDINKDDIETVKKAIINARIKQSKFRNNVLKSKNHCLFTGINYEKLLIAGHIKPWSLSNNDERIDANNGILLSPMFDKLFDKHYITFNKDGYILWSNRLNQKTIDLITKGVDNIMLIKIEITDSNQEYYNHHRTMFLKLEESTNGNN